MPPCSLNPPRAREPIFSMNLVLAHLTAFAPLAPATPRRVATGHSTRRIAAFKTSSVTVEVESGRRGTIRATATLNTLTFATAGCLGITSPSTTATPLSLPDNSSVFSRNQRLKYRPTRKLPARPPLELTSWPAAALRAPSPHQLIPSPTTRRSLRQSRSRPPACPLNPTPLPS